MKLLSRVRLLATPWTAAHQAPPSMGFSRQEYWSEVPLPSPIYGLKYLKYDVDVCFTHHYRTNTYNCHVEIAKSSSIFQMKE